MDVALVEHAEHDVDGDQRREDQERLARERLAERLRRAVNAARIAGGRSSVARARSIASTASPSETPCAVLNDSVTDGNWPWCAIASGAGRCSKLRERARAGPALPFVART